MCTGSHPFIPAPGTARVEMQMLQAAQKIENVLHFAKGAEWTAAELGALATAVVTYWDSDLSTSIATNVTLERIKCTDLEVENGAYSELFPTPQPAGRFAGSPLPNGDTLRVRFTTGLVGRNFRGGPYHPGLVFTMLDATENAVTSTIGAQIIDAWASFQAHIQTSTGGALAIVSYCFNNTWRTGANVEIVTNIGLADLLLDSQRRRRPGRGN